MSERCPLLGEQGELAAPTGDRYGAVWDSGLPALCMSTCFRTGHDNAERQHAIKTEVYASDGDMLLTEGDTDSGEGIQVTSKAGRIGHIDIDDGEYPENVLLHSQFGFRCLVESD